MDRDEIEERLREVDQALFSAQAEWAKIALEVLRDIIHEHIPTVTAIRLRIDKYGKVEIGRVFVEEKEIPMSSTLQGRLGKALINFDIDTLWQCCGTRMLELSPFYDTSDAIAELRKIEEELR